MEVSSNSIRILMHIYITGFIDRQVSKLSKDYVGLAISIYHRNQLAKYMHVYYTLCYMRDEGWKGVRERLRDREGGEEREREKGRSRGNG